MLTDHRCATTPCTNKRHTVLLCGNMASGKSTAAQLFRSYGAVVIDLDEVGRTLLDSGQALVAQLAQQFGSDILHNNRLSRPMLARRAFADADSVAALNALVHPKIFSELIARLAALAPENRLVIIECSAGEALKHFASIADEILVIDAPVELRKQRAIARGMMPADVEARMKIQPTDALLLAHADTIIENKGSQAEFVDHLSQWFERTARQLGMD